MHSSFALRHLKHQSLRAGGKQATKKASGEGRIAPIKLSPAYTLMGAAIGFAAMIVAFSIFLPEVLAALNEFLLVFLYQITAALQNIPTQ